MNYIGIDIGGMSAKAGLVDSSGKILQKKVVKTFQKMQPDELENAIFRLILDLLKEAKIKSTEIDGIGIGFPGIVDGEKKLVVKCTNLNLKNVQFGENLKNRLNLNCEVKIENDANLATLGEAKFGTAQNSKNVVMLTLGTGVGSGIIANGQLILGNGSAGGEAGHMVIEMNGEECACGRRGCFEVYASAMALMKQAVKQAEKFPQSKLAVEIAKNGVNGKLVFDCAKCGDKSALEVVENYARYLGEGITNLVNIFAPEIVVLGGGVSAQGEFLLGKVRKFVEMHRIGKDCNPPVKIECATLGNDAGIVGVVGLFE